jgi:hypothetical protein
MLAVGIVTRGSYIPAPATSHGAARFTYVANTAVGLASRYEVTVALLRFGTYSRLFVWEALRNTGNERPAVMVGAVFGQLFVTKALRVQSHMASGQVVIP